MYQDPDTNRAPQRQRQGHTGSIFAQAQPVPASAAAPANGVPQPTASLPVVNPYQIPANMLVMPSMMPDGEAPAAQPSLWCRGLLLMTNCTRMSKCHRVRPSSEESLDIASWIDMAMTGHTDVVLPIDQAA